MARHSGYAAGVLNELAPGGLYVLRGPRRVGKSVEIKRTIEVLIASGIAPRGIVHAAVDGWRAADLGRLVSAARLLMPRGGPRCWFIDEITGITDGWPEQIKWLRDNDAQFRNDTVVLTGSSASDPHGVGQGACRQTGNGRRSRPRVAADGIPDLHAAGRGRAGRHRHRSAARGPT